MLVIQIALGIVLGFLLISILPWVLAIVAVAGITFLHVLSIFSLFFAIPIVSAIVVYFTSDFQTALAAFLGAFVLELLILFLNSKRLKQIESNQWVEGIGDLIYYVLVMSLGIVGGLFAWTWIAISSEYITKDKDLSIWISGGLLPIVLGVAVFLSHRKLRHRLHVFNRPRT